MKKLILIDTKAEMASFHDSINEIENVIIAESAAGSCDFSDFFVVESKYIRKLKIKIELED